MKKNLFAVVLLCCFVGLAWGANAPAFQGAVEYGKLTVYSDVAGADIYVDAKFVGQDRATISNIPVGKHYVRVVKDDKEIQTGIVEVKEGQETIIVAKQSEELLSKTRKPTQVALLGSFSAVGYKFSPAVGGLSSFDYKPQFGLGAELKYPIPVIDVNIDLGFVLNMPSTLRFYDLSGGTWEEGQVSLSSPYICLSKEVLKSGPFRINCGGGFNYALYTPGGGVQLSIEPRLGYQFYVEGARPIDQGQKMLVKAGYASYAGKAAGVTDITSAGYYLQAGLAYQL
ncbi:MAG: PEGA domain-containing protein [Candidatus Margulisiibacteriota bacterium]